MPTLIERVGSAAARSRIGRAFLADERRKTADAFRVMQEGYLAGPWELPPQELVQRLSEQDPYQIYDLLQSLNWDLIGGYGVDVTQERQRAVSESRRLFKYSPVAQWAIWLWTGWGLGDRVTITITDEEGDKEQKEQAARKNSAQEVFDEFWGAERNAHLLGPDNLDDLSDWTLVDGNTYLVYYASEQDGETTINEIDPDEITEIVTMPGDKNKPLFYKREFEIEAPGGNTAKGKQSLTWYYPDWKAYFTGELDEAFPGDEDGRTLAQVVLPEGAIRADTGEKVTTSPQAAAIPIGGEEEKTGTGVCIQHISHNRKERGSLWGWPIATCGRAFTSAHKRFVESRLTVAEAIAMFVRRKKVKGGSRAVDSIIATIASNLNQSQWTDTNPPGTAGSTEVENEAVDTTDLPMRTGATDASADNKVFAWMAALGFGLFPTSMGLDTARWATAVEMDKAQSMLFQRYQTFWATQFRRMVKIVLRMREKFNGASFGDYTVEVSVDTFSLADFPGIAESIGDLASTLLIPLAEQGVAETDAVRPIAQELLRICLQALGVSKADDLTADEVFEPEEEEEEPAPLPAPAFQPPPLPAGQPEQPGGAGEVRAQVARDIGRNIGAGIEWALAEMEEA